MTETPSATTCQNCGSHFDPQPELRDLCPKCLIHRVMVESRDGATDTDSRQKTPAFAVPAVEELEPLFPQFSDFELLGVGGMGAVYRARQNRLDRNIALKLLPRESGANPAFAERFAREARALARLSHPHIVNLHDFGESGGYYYFVMEFVQGVTLRQAMRDRSLTPAESLRVVSDICAALQFAHDQGIVHRDIKPENILLSKNGNVKIADFGLAKLLAVPDSDQLLTASRHVVGTPHYMAPEQMERPLEVDHRADIYSLGVVFYEMLTGELPIGRFAPPSRKVIIDVRLDEVVLRTLEKEPGRRYQHVSDVAAEVDHISGTDFAQQSGGLRRLVRSVQQWCLNQFTAVNAKPRPPAKTREPDEIGAARSDSRLNPAAVLKWLAARFHRGWSRITATVRPGELCFGLASAIAFTAGCILMASGKNTGDVIVAGLTLCGPAVVVARMLVGRQESWETLRPAHWLVVPPLTVAYLGLLLILLTCPGIMVILFGAAPLVLDVEPGWSFLGERFAETSYGRQIPRYWTQIACTSLSVTTLWWINVSLIARFFPRTFCVVFHPSSPAQIRTVATYTLLIAIVALAPVSALLWFILTIQ